MPLLVRAGYNEILAEAGLGRDNLICPIFVSDRAETLGNMQGAPFVSSAYIAQGIQIIKDAGVPSVILFGIPGVRDVSGSSAIGKNGVVQRAVREIKSAFGRSMSVITDVCLCQYNLSGHCGLLSGDRVDNDSTIATLARIAVSHAEAGADIVAPSAMMDGQVRKIRQTLDAAGHSTKILSYSAKHSSSLYTPFRSAAFAKKGSIDKSTYQVPYSSPRQAMREIEQDIIEGADMVMVKPGLAYLDLVRRAKERFSVPVAVQNVSGEYAMIKAAGRRGWIDEEEWKVLSLASMRRAGADRIISYFALQVAGYLD